ncbi:unnamed protein product [Penicillium olsonii]|nr:unnamed protein product [Penicillium olsonii]
MAVCFAQFFSNDSIRPFLWAEERIQKSRCCFHYSTKYCHFPRSVAPYRSALAVPVFTSLKA